MKILFKSTIIEMIIIMKNGHYGYGMVVLKENNMNLITLTILVQ